MTLFWGWFTFALACSAFGIASGALNKTNELEKRIEQLENADRS